MMIRGQIYRELTITRTIHIPLRAFSDQGKPRFGRMQIQRRGLIAKLLKAKPKLK